MKFIRIASRLFVAGSVAAAAFQLASAAETNPPAAKPAVTMTDLFPDQIVAKGKGFEIKRSEVDEAVLNVTANIAAQGRVLSAADRAGVAKQVLDRLIQMHILLTKATDADQAKGKADTQKNLADAKKKAGSDEAFALQVKAIGMTEDVLQKRMADEATGEAVLERELKINVTDDDVKKFYDDNPAKFEVPEMVRASHILVSTRDPVTDAELSDAAKKEKLKRAEEALKRAKAGEDFAKLAKEYSDDPGSKDRGGEYTFARGQMVPEFETAAFSLGTNQISDIVTTRFGYHIIKVSEKIPAKKRSLAEVSDNIRQYLIMQQMEKLAPPYLEQARKDATVEILDDSLKLPPKSPEPAKDALK